MSDWSRRDVLRGGTLGVALGLGTGAAAGTAAAAGGDAVTVGIDRFPDRLSPFSRSGAPVYEAVFDTAAVRDAEDGRLRPWTLDWTVDDDGVTLSLGDDRPVWPDGSELTAADVAFTFDYVTDSNEPARRIGQYRGVDAAAVERVDVVDDASVRLGFGSRPGMWTRLLTVPLLPESVWSGVENPREEPPEAALSGSGLYAVESAGDGEVALTLRDAPHPTRTAVSDLVPASVLPDDDDANGPFVSTIVVRGGIRGGEDARDAVRNGGFTAAQPRQWGAAEAGDGVRTHPSWRSRHVLFNARRVPFDDPAFRRFLAETWDASRHLELRGAAAAAADGPVETARGVVEEFERTRSSFVEDGEVNVEAARSALESSGKHAYEFTYGNDYNVSTDDSRVLHVNGVHFSTTHTDNDDTKGQGRMEILTWTSERGVEKSMQRWEDVLRTIGVPAAVKRVSVSTFSERVVRQQAFDVTEVSYRFGADGEGLASLYGSPDAVPDALDLTGYAGADDALSRALSTPTPDDRTAALADAAAQIYADAPGFAVEHLRTLTAVRESWSGWVDSADGPTNRLSYHALRSPETTLVETATPEPETATATETARAASNDIPGFGSGVGPQLILGGAGALGTVYVAGRLIGRITDDGTPDDLTRPDAGGSSGASSGRTDDGPRSGGSDAGATDRDDGADGGSAGGDAPDAPDGAAVDGDEPGDGGESTDGDAADPDPDDAPAPDDSTAAEREAGGDAVGGAAAGFLADVPGLEPGGGRIAEDGDLVVHGGVLDGEDVHVVTPSDAVDASRYDAFERAGRQWSALSTDDNVVGVVETGETPRPWVAVEPLTEWRPVRDLSEPTPQTVVDVVGAACQAVQGASLYNVRHLALTPDRVYTDDDGRSAKVHLWCLDEFLDVDGPTPFTAPEQLPDADVGTGKPTDVYRLGAVAYTLLRGEPPFDPDSETLAEDIASGEYVSLADADDLDEAVRSFAGVVDKALSTDPDDRYTSAHHLRTDLHGAL